MRSPDTRARRRARGRAAELAIGFALLAAPVLAQEPPRRIWAELGPGYPSAEAAFHATFVASGIGARGYREDREYAAALFLMPDGHWYSTTVQAGERDRSDIPYRLVPVAALRVAGAHTHGQPRVALDPGHLYGVDYSAADRQNAEHNYRVTDGRIASQLLLSSELRILRLTLHGCEEGCAPTRGPAGVTATEDLVEQDVPL